MSMLVECMTPAEIYVKYIYYQVVNCWPKCLNGMHKLVHHSLDSFLCMCNREREREHNHLQEAGPATVFQVH